MRRSPWRFKQRFFLWRIGKLLRATSLKEVLSYCDKYETEGRDHPVIMFDRNGASFNTILDIYRTGMFHLCDSTCATIRLRTTTEGVTSIN